MNSSVYTKVRSLHQAFMDVNRLVAVLKKNGASGAAITDAGVVSSIEDYRPAFEASGLKLIPGCEITVEGEGKLVILAKNDFGWKGVSKIVTKSNENLDEDDQPKISRDALSCLMKTYKGSIVALTGGEDGVLFSALRKGEEVDSQIQALLDKQDQLIGPFEPVVAEVSKQVSVCQKAYDAAIIERDDTKRTAETKFAAREKAIAKLTGEERAREEKKLLEEKEAAEEAKKVLADKKAAVAEAKKALSAAESRKKALDTQVDEWIRLEDEINVLRSGSVDVKAEAETVLRRLQEMFGRDCLYVQIMNHGTAVEAACLPEAVKAAKAAGVKLVAANDACMVDGSDEEVLRRNLIRSLKDGKSFVENSEGDRERYVKTDAQIREMLVRILPEDVVDEAISNKEAVFASCNVEFKVGKHYPKFSQTENADDILDREIERGIKWRFPNGMDEEHQKRLEYEKQIIKSMGYSDYHLVVKDFLEYGRLLGYVPTEKLSEAPLTISELKDYIRANGWKNQGLLIGPGRGSAVGSLVCYLLGITALDPIKYNLLFERFLNPERVSMPDIDSDIANRTRDKVIEYVKNRYGNMAVCGIMTTNAQAAKGCVRIAAKFFGLRTYGEPLTMLGNTIAKDMPDEKSVKISFSSHVTENGKFTVDENEMTLLEYLEKKYAEDPNALEILRWASIIEGTFTAYGAHAAGIVISDNDDVSEYLPLRWNSKMGMYTTQCDMVQVEDNGLLKFDFLGLKTLDIITETLRMIEGECGVIDPLQIPLDDKDVYREILSAGKTNSVFQFESDGMKAMLKKFRPETFEDLIILVSMFRPGPLQYLDGVIDVKNGKKPLTYMTPELEPIVGKTYGAIVYQEQVMEIFQKLAGYTLGGADMVRRAMGKKKLEKLMHEKEAFINGDASRGIIGCVANGISAEVATALFDQMTDFASYAFNKSHAAAYAYNAYITAWLKYHHTAEFFASALNWAADKDEISKLMYDAASFGVTVMAPDVNLSGKDFTVENRAGKKIVRFGLGSVAGVKDNADEIISERLRNGSFTSAKDFYCRVRPNSKVAVNLVSAGALDQFSGNREEIKAVFAAIAEPVKEKEKKLSFIRSAEYVLPMIDKLADNDAVVKAQKEAGYKPEVVKKTTVEALEKRIDTAKTAVKNLTDEITLVNPTGIREDKRARMEAEKELLGMYVTEHPMEYYPEASEIGAPTVSEIKEGRGYAYGCVTGLVIKGRKSDGAKMAFFKLEDKTGSVDVCVFTKAYGSYGDVLKEGAVVKMFGTCNVEQNDGDENFTIKFFADKLETVDEKKTSAIMYVSSYAAFHLEAEEAVKVAYGDEKGSKLYIHDAMMDEIRQANYRVSANILSLPNVEEILI